MNTMPFLKRNLEALAAVNNPAVFWLAQQRPDDAAVAARLFVNRWELLDWKLPAGEGLFETFPPAAFYKGWQTEDDKLAQSATFIVGGNLGYGLNQVLVNTPNSHKVVVLEPDHELLMACLGQTDYTPFIEIGKLHFLPPDRETVRQAVQLADKQFLFGRIYLRLDMPSQQLGPEYARWGRYLQDCLEGLSVELTTLRKRQDTMVDNELHNFRQAFAHGSLRDIKNSARGMTAVILGAGPSLQQHGPLLARNPGQVFHATALQTLPAVHELGIKPHLAMAIDYSTGMKAVFDRLDRDWARDIPLIYSTKLHPEVVARYPGPKIPLWTRGGLATYLMEGNDYVLDAAGNVSVAMFRLLAHCGVSRIVLCGQDFAWKDGPSHAAGHHAAGKNTRSNVTLKNSAGEPLRSALAYVTALRDMERDIQRTGIEVLNLYGGGAVIQGAENVTPEDMERGQLFMSAPGSLQRFLDAMLLARVPRPAPVFEPRLPGWGASLRNAQKYLEKLFKKPAAKQREIREGLSRFHDYLRHDPLTVPYLYNEIMDVAGLAHGARTFTYKDFLEFKKIVRRVRDKIRHMDELLCHEERASQAA